jgi:hypothetical protein
VPIGTAQNPTLSLTSTTQTQFELPNNVLNLSRSKLCFDLLVPLRNSLTKFANVCGNALSLIDRITLTSRSGVILCDIPNSHIFGNLVSSVNTKLTDLLSRNTLLGGVISVQSTPVTTSASPVHAESLLSNASALLLSPQCLVSGIVRCNGAVNKQTSAAVYGTIAYTTNTEPVNMFIAPVVAAANAISYQIELSAFKDTIMELNKNIYFGDNLVLTINWNSCTKTQFTNTRPTTSGLLSQATADLVVPTQLNNSFLYTATETDPTFFSKLLCVVNGGQFSMLSYTIYILSKIRFIC